MKQTPYCQLIIELIGDGPDIAQVVADLRQEGLDVEELR